MMNCPVCASQITENPCPACGFDCSCHYEAFPTFGVLPDHPLSVGKRKQQWEKDQQSIYHCTSCGCSTFIIRPVEMTAQCSTCKRVFHLRFAGSENAPARAPEKSNAALNTQGAAAVQSSSKPRKSVIAANDKRVASVCVRGLQMIACYRDGTVGATGSFMEDLYAPVSQWTDIVSVAAGMDFVVGLQEDGHVVATGKNEKGQCNTQQWSDIVAVAAGNFHTVGLRRDGTVVAVGDNSKHQCDTAAWTDVVSIEAGCSYTAGLRKDGTGVSTDYGHQVKIRKDSWKQIQSIHAGDFDLIGLRRDGTVMITGLEKLDRHNVSGWTNIAAVAAGSMHTVGLCKDGAVISTRVKGVLSVHNVERWDNMKAVSAGYQYTLGLRENGTVIATGKIPFSTVDLNSWKNVEKIYAGSLFAIGVCKDGTLVTAGLTSRQRQQLMHRHSPF